MSALKLVGVSRDFGGGEGVKPTTLEVEAGEMVVVLGPSGSGKTTLLRIASGFERPDTGTVEIGGVDVTGLGPEARPTAMVFQSHALWPHMTVRENIGFGLQVRKKSRREIESKVDELLELTQMGRYEHRRPQQLSGGQRQRVALARALAVEPAVLLLDEPLSALDARLRVDLRRELRALQRRLGVTAVYITHDQDDALTLADRVAVMNQGSICQIGSPEDVWERPADAFVARFCGDAVLIPCRPGSMRDRSVVTGDDVRLTVAGGDPGGAWLAIRSSAVRLVADADGDGSNANEVPVHVVDCRYRGGDMVATVRLGDATLVDVPAGGPPGPEAGPARLVLDPDRLWCVRDDASVTDDDDASDGQP